MKREVVLTLYQKKEKKKKDMLKAQYKELLATCKFKFKKEKIYQYIKKKEKESNQINKQIYQ